MMVGLKVTGRVSLRIGDRRLLLRVRVSMSVSTLVGMRTRVRIGVKTRVR